MTMTQIKAQFLHQHKDKVVYEQNVVIGSMTLTTDSPLLVCSVSKLSFRMPLFAKHHKHWMWRWIDGHIYKEMQTKRKISLLWSGWKKYIFEPLMIKARINQSDWVTNGFLWLDVDCYLDTRQTKGFAKIFQK